MGLGLLGAAGATVDQATSTFTDGALGMADVLKIVREDPINGRKNLQCIDRKQRAYAWGRDGS